MQETLNTRLPQGRGMTEAMFIIDDFAFYKKKVTKRIHPKGNRQRNKRLKKKVK